MGRPHAISNIVAVLCAALALAWPLEGRSQPPPGTPGAAARAATGSQGDGPVREPGTMPPYKPPKTGGGPDWLTVAIVAGAIGAAAVAANQPTLSERLLKDGPDFPDKFPLGTFAVTGFIQNGWPILLDYVTDETAEAWLTVTVGKKTWKVPLGGGHQQLVFPFENDWAVTAKPAVFTIHAQYPDGRQTPAQVDVIAIGAGPRAVTADALRRFGRLDNAPGQPPAVGAGLCAVDLAAINSLAFFRANGPPGGAFAQFTYRTEQGFNRTNAEVLRYAYKKQGKATLATVKSVVSYPSGLRPAGPYGPQTWDGREYRSTTASLGAHRVRVKGWQTDQDWSWLGALSYDVLVTP